MSERQFLITEDGSHTLFVPELNETYHSAHGAIQESAYVFIQQGLQFIKELKKHEKIMVFEVGFGTGLNALLAALFAEEHQLAIEYTSIETAPISPGEVAKLNYPRQIHNDLSQDIFIKIHKSPWEEKIPVSTYFQLLKIKKALQIHEFDKRYNMCFFDAFAPSKQAEMWEREILEKVYSALDEGGVFVTYCAKGQLKRDLHDIGFDVETLQGPPGKKEMVRAIKT